MEQRPRLGGPCLEPGAQPARANALALNASPADPDFDASRTDAFPPSCSLHGRHPGHPATQATPHTPSLDRGRGWRLASPRGGIGSPEGTLLPRHSFKPAKNAPMQMHSSKYDWSVLSMTDGAGRRVITLCRSPKPDLVPPPAAARYGATSRPAPDVRRRYPYGR